MKRTVFQASAFKRNEKMAGVHFTKICRLRSVKLVFYLRSVVLAKRNVFYCVQTISSTLEFHYETFRYDTVEVENGTSIREEVIFFVLSQFYILTCFSRLF